MEPMYIYATPTQVKQELAYKEAQHKLTQTAKLNKICSSCKGKDEEPKPNM